MGLIRVAIVGTGPSGLYLGKYLARLVNVNKVNRIEDSRTDFSELNGKKKEVKDIKLKIDYFEKKEHLLGHFNYGLAPDKLKIKLNAFKLLNEEFRYFTNVNVVSDSRDKGLNIEVLKKFYNFVILCIGCDLPKGHRLRNESLGVFDSLEVVKYYNRSFLTNFNFHNYLTENRINVIPYSSSNNFTNFIDNYNNYKDNKESCTNNSTINKGDNYTDLQQYLTDLKKRKKKINIGVIGGGNVSLDILRTFGQTPEKLKKLKVDADFVDFVGQVEVGSIFVYIRSNLITNKFSNSELNELFLTFCGGDTSDNYPHTTPTVNGSESNNLNPQQEEDRKVKFVLFGDKLENYENSEEVKKNRKLNRKLQIFQKLISSCDNNLDHSDNYPHSNNNLQKENEEKKEAKILNIHFRFNCRVENIINEENRIKFVEYSHLSEKGLKSDAVDLLVKCLGSESSENALGLRGKVDNERIFLHGWARKNCSGNLSETLNDSLELAHNIYNLINPKS